MVDVVAALHRHFGHTSFRPGQADVVQAVLDGRDVLAVMPTGSGKSLGFQLPALLLPGTTLVVSPLISLMKDQVDELERRGISAAALHSMLTSDTRQETLSAARRGEIRLLYVAPERFASDHFLRVLRDLPVARFIVDEAHCVSEWGHDFRPDYRRLKTAAADCRRSDGQGRGVPIAAFTATATPEVRDDIIDLLGLAEPRVVVAGFDRPNIDLRVRPVAGDLEKQQLLTELVGNRRALVYAATRRNAETAAETLQTAGLQAAAYHAGLSDAERTRVQDAFASGALQVVCATNAFGMGIDRPDVESVVHVDIPGSLEAYYQEIGRAGRDGRAAIATLLWNYADVKTREFLIDRDRDDAAGRPSVRLDSADVARRKEIEHKKLRRMVAYADSAGCLRATILRYFGDPAAREPCGACGNCGRRAPLDAPARLVVRKILSGIARAGERYGRRKIAAMLVGNIDELPDSLTRLSTTGLLRDEHPRIVERWIDAASAAGLVRVSDDQYRTLSLTPLGRDVMAGRVEDVQMVMPVARQTPSIRRTSRGRLGVRRHPTHGAARGRRTGQMGHTAGSELATGEAKPLDAVVEALRAWRLSEARRRAVAPFVILHDRTLTAIATSLPRSMADLQAVRGIGPAKLSTYGDAILSMVASIITEKT
ncbi:MAG: ATP-dependent DNA helicase RecQ [Acidobacteria bacterium]|nr:ATP-dependent DNA helicase RecQ [Acidobacteriota bacterium]